jgi:hypothetical protein
MRWISRLAGGVRAASVKSFVEPPFWSLDRPLWTPSESDRVRIANDFEGYVHDVYEQSGIAFACVATRMLLFSQGRFQWRRLRQGAPAEIFGNTDLRLLERPWSGATTSALLTHIEGDVSMAGNAWYTTTDDQGRFGAASRRGTNRRIVRMRPDWITVLLGSRSSVSAAKPDGDPLALDAKPIGIWYRPRGMFGDNDADQLLLPDEVMHYWPIPDPTARWRGMSWLTPAIREVRTDLQAQRHKMRFFELGATLQTVVTLDESVSVEDFDAFVERFRDRHEGVDNAYRTLLLGGGADVTVVGTDMAQMDFRALQGASETRIAMDSRIHPVILGSAEGMQGSSLNAGNYAQARRNVADGWLRPQWESCAGALETLVPPPDGGSHLWYDESHVAFLREDRKDAAEIARTRAVTYRQYLDAGYTPESVKRAMLADDESLLEHSGMFSVQLQKPETSEERQQRQQQQQQRSAGTGSRNGDTPTEGEPPALIGAGSGARS